MTNGEIFSLIAVILSFIGVVISFVFSYRKATKERDEERENNVTNIVTIKNNINNIKLSVDEIKEKIEKIDDRTQSDHERLIEHGQKINNLEKAAYKGVI